MGQNIKISIKQYDREMSAEIPEDSGLKDIMECFVGILRGLTFGDWVIKSIRDWCNDQLPEEEEGDKDEKVTERSSYRLGIDDLR